MTNNVALVSYLKINLRLLPPRDELTTNVPPEQKEKKEETPGKTWPNNQGRNISALV